MKKLIAILLIFCMLFFSGCYLFKIDLVDAREAVSFAEEFCLALGEDIELAKEYLSSDSTPSKDNLQDFIKEIELENNVCFSDGVVLKDRDGFTFNPKPYDSLVCTYKFGCELVIGNSVVNLLFAVRKDENGYSIVHVEQGTYGAE